MKKEPLTPHHINATVDDFTGNQGIGRYVFLPGSDGRAKEIAQHFNQLTVKPHPRGHNLYLGTIAHAKEAIDVATISTGMGCPSMEIILHELFQLGAKRFLRVGTGGSLQPQLVKLGNIVNAQAAVRDEKTSRDYAPLSVPAIASNELVSAISLSAKNLGLLKELRIGTVHCKSSLYAREFGCGPREKTNKAYLNLLTQCGILASEMETATLFIQSQIYHHQLRKLGTGPLYRVLCGALLGIITVSSQHFSIPKEQREIDNNLISVALESIKILSTVEKAEIND